MSGSWPEYRQNIIVMCRNPAPTTPPHRHISKSKSGYNSVIIFMKAFSTVKLRLSNYILFRSYISTWIASELYWLQTRSTKMQLCVLSKSLRKIWAPREKGNVLWAHYNGKFFLSFKCTVLSLFFDYVQIFHLCSYVNWKLFF